MKNNVHYVLLATKSPCYFGPKEPTMKKHIEKNFVLLTSQSIDQFHLNTRPYSKPYLHITYEQRATERHKD